MELIEQLGGYDEAKKYLDKLQKTHIHEQTEDTISYLPDDLLVYRRENNIFESSDCVIVDGHDDVYQIQYVYESACGYGMYQGRQFSHSMIERHATPQEIEAGRRL